MDDFDSLERSPWILQWQREATGRQVLGAVHHPAACPPLRRLREARGELLRWRSGLQHDEIPFRSWHWGPRPRLREDRAPVLDAWQRRCQTKAARASIDLQLRSFALIPLPRTSARAVLAKLAAAAEPAGTGSVAGQLVRIERGLEFLSDLRHAAGTAADQDSQSESRGRTSTS